MFRGSKIERVLRSELINSGAEAKIFSDPDDTKFIYKVFKIIRGTDPTDRIYLSEHTGLTQLTRRLRARSDNKLSEATPMSEGGMTESTQEKIQRRTRLVFLRDALVLSILHYTNPETFPAVTDIYSKEVAMYKRPFVHSVSGAGLFNRLKLAFKFALKGVSMDLIGERNFLVDTAGATKYVDGVEFTNEKRFLKYVMKFLATGKNEAQVKIVRRLLKHLQRFQTMLKEEI